MKTIYIDADSILYRASHLACADKDLAEAESIGCEEGEELGLEDAIQSSQLEDMKRIFHSMTNDIVRAVQEDAEAKGYEVNPEPIHVITVKGKHTVCTGLADNFRYKIMAEVEDEKVKGYKANRAGMEVPDGLDDIYEYAFNLETTICESGVEADDVVVYYGR